QVSTRFPYTTLFRSSNLTSEHGIRFRMNRSIQTEGFFGIMKEDYHFRRFLLRGTEKVRVEVLSLAFAFNFRRLYNKQRAGLNGRSEEHTSELQSREK